MKKARLYGKVLLMLALMLSTLQLVPKPAFATTGPVPLESVSQGSMVKFGGKDWIVLDPTTRYVMAPDLVDSRPFDGNMKNVFDPGNANNLAYWLHHDFVLYLLRKTDQSTLYFAILCYAFATRMVVVREMFLVWLFPQLSWEMAVKMEYLPIYMGVPLFVRFIQLQFPQDMNRYVPFVPMRVGILFSLVVLFGWKSREENCSRIFPMN